jgi:hypothetical protein
VYVEHGLAGAGAGIDHGPETGIRVALFVRHPRPNAKQVPQQDLILLRSVVERFEMLARDHQQVRRRLGINVTNHHAPFILMNEVARYVTGDDPAKQATLFRHLPNSLIRI